MSDSSTNSDNSGPGPDARFFDIPHYPIGQVPEEILGGDRRAPLGVIIAKRALVAGYEGSEDDIEATVKDVLTDLRHLCDKLGLSFEELNESAQRHYDDEVSDNPEFQSEAK